ncbi:MAG: efflux RND transporter permease subunit [Verrucomicrobiales bacterium]
MNYRFAGEYENQVRAEARLLVIVPLSLMIIFLLLYGQFRSIARAMVVFSGIFLAWSGGFLLLWCFNQPWFLDFSVAGVDFQQVFQVHPINLSVAVWVGFLALFGIATDDGVLMTTYLAQQFEENRPQDVKTIRAAVIAGAAKRIRPAMMTTATTILALLPVVTSVGRGSDVIVPMALPTVGGMTVAILTVITVPTLFCWIEEFKQQKSQKQQKTKL